MTYEETIINIKAKIGLRAKCELETDEERQIVWNALTKQIPIVRGEWKENEEGLLVCSACNKEAITVDVTEYEYEDEENLLLCDYCPRECGYHRESIRTDFCPHCGADMRDEKE